MLALLSPIIEQRWAAVRSDLSRSPLLHLLSLPPVAAGETEPARLRLSWSGLTPERKQSPSPPRCRPRLRSAGLLDLWRRELRGEKCSAGARPGQISPGLSHGIYPRFPHTATPQLRPRLTERISPSSPGPGEAGEAGAPTSEQTGGLSVGRVGRTLSQTELSSHILPPSGRLGNLPCHIVIVVL